MTSKDANSDVGARTTLLTEHVGTQASIFSIKKKLNKQKENTESPSPSRRKQDREARGGAAQMPIPFQPSLRSEWTPAAGFQMEPKICL